MDGQLPAAPPEAPDGPHSRTIPYLNALDQNREWRLTPVNWELTFPRSPQHLSNQLRGKRFNADRPQLTLFGDTYHGLPADVRAEVDRNNIAVVGFDLSVSQQRAYDAALYLINASGGKSQRIVITPADWLRAYGVERRRRNTRDKSEMSSSEREEAFTALASLSVMPWLISYDAMVGGRWKTRQEVATLWNVGTEKDKDPRNAARGPSARPMAPQDLVPLVQSLRDAERISIRFHDIWFDQHDSFYFYKPAHLYQRLSLAISGAVRRHNRHTHAFLDWVFSEVGRIRVEEKKLKEADAAVYKPRELYTFSEKLEVLALQLRMTAQVSKRNWGRIRVSISDSAALAQQAQIISGFEWKDDELVISFSARTFSDLDQYHESLEAQRADAARRQKARQRRPESGPVTWPYPRPVGDYSPNQLTDMKRGQLAELAKLRERMRNDGGRKPTDAEAHAIAFHQAVVRMLENALVPKPSIS